VYGATDASAWRPSVGAAVSWAYPLHSFVDLRLQLGGEWRPWGPHFGVAGAPDSELVAPWSVVLRVGLGAHIW
jgi:hypothetical protein